MIMKFEISEIIIAIIDEFFHQSLELIGEHLMTIVRSVGEPVQH